MNSLLEQAIVANRAMRFRDWCAQLDDVKKKELSDEFSPLMTSFNAITPDGISISAAFESAGNLLMMGVVDGINREWHGGF